VSEVLQISAPKNPTTAETGLQNFAIGSRRFSGSLIHRFSHLLPFMQILEELGTFIISVALAVVLIGVATVMLYYFNPQQPLDHAKAAFYPLVKPLNATHVWLGVKFSADKVEVVELKYQYRWRWVDVPVARFTADRAVWLNATDGRPVAAPCSANVTVATRCGPAARSLSFTPVCIQREEGVWVDLTGIKLAMEAYARFLAECYAMANTPVLTAYYRVEPGGTSPDMLYVELKNIWREPLVLIMTSDLNTVNNLLSGRVLPYPEYAPGRGLPYPVLLEPNEVIRLSSDLLHWPVVNAPGFSDAGWHRWIYLDAFVHSLELWTNGVPAYNNTGMPAYVKTPQGYYINLTTHTITADPNCRPAQQLPQFSPGYNHWEGWVRLDCSWVRVRNTAPGVTEYTTIYVMKVPLSGSWAPNHRLYIFALPASELKLFGGWFNRTTKVSGDRVNITTVVRNGTQTVGLGVALPYVLYPAVLWPQSDGTLLLQWLPTSAPAADPKYVRNASLAPGQAYVITAPGSGARILYADGDVWIASMKTLYGIKLTFGSRLPIGSVQVYSDIGCSYPESVEPGGVLACTQSRYSEITDNLRSWSARCDYSAPLGNVAAEDTGQRREEYDFAKKRYVNYWLLNVSMYTLNGLRYLGQVWAPDDVDYACSYGRFTFSLKDGGYGHCCFWVERNKPRWSCTRRGTAFTLKAELNNDKLYIYRDGRVAAVVSDWRSVPAVRSVLVQWKMPKELPEPSAAAFVIDHDSFDPLNQHNAARGVRTAYRGGEEKASVPYAIRADLRGSLVYFVNATADYRAKLVTASNNRQYVRASWAQTLHVYYLGQYLGQPFNQFLRERLTRDRLTAYDAIYAVTYHEPLSDVPGGGSASQPDSYCIPRKEYGTPAEAEITSLSINGDTARGTFSAIIPVREYGCGQVRRYNITKPIHTFWTQTQGLGITDDQGNICIGNDIIAEGRIIICNTSINQRR
jgi:hypothetical protein